MKKITLSTFRRLADAEETMLRGSMPTLSALDATPLPGTTADLRACRAATRAVVAERRGVRLVRLTATVAEVADAR